MKARRTETRFFQPQNSILLYYTHHTTRARGKKLRVSWVWLRMWCMSAFFPRRLCFNPIDPHCTRAAHIIVSHITLIFCSLYKAPPLPSFFVSIFPPQNIHMKVISPYQQKKKLFNEEGMRNSRLDYYFSWLSRNTSNVHLLSMMIFWRYAHWLGS